MPVTKAEITIYNDECREIHLLLADIQQILIHWLSLTVIICLASQILYNYGVVDTLLGR
jgi:hypothetical protein